MTRGAVAERARETREKLGAAFGLFILASLAGTALLGRGMTARVPLTGLAALVVLGGVSVGGRRAGTAYPAALSLAMVVPLIGVAASALEGSVVTARGVRLLALIGYAGLFVVVYVVWWAVVLHTSMPIRLRANAARAVGALTVVASVATCAASLLRCTRHDDPNALRGRIEWLCATAGPRACEDHGVHLGFEDAEQGRVHVLDTTTGESGDIPVFHWSAFGRVREKRLWIVTQDTRHAPLGFVGPPFVPHGAAYVDFAADLAPPVPWTLSALVGLVIAAFAVRPRRADRALRERLAWREETRPEGPVLVSPALLPASYRATGDEGVTVVPGTLAEVRAALAQRSLERWSFAVAAMSLLAAPLFTAAAMGFLAW